MHFQSNFFSLFWQEKLRLVIHEYPSFYLEISEEFNLNNCICLSLEMKNYYYCLSSFFVFFLLFSKLRRIQFTALITQCRYSGAIEGKRCLDGIGSTSAGCPAHVDPLLTESDALTTDTILP